MIYEIPDEEIPISQGDIFINLPLTINNLNDIIVIDDEGEIETNWLTIRDRKRSIVKSVIKPAIGILASQNCDASRQPYLTFFKIDTFRDIIGERNMPGNVKKWVSMITQRSRINPAWFYLPSDPEIGFDEKMAINFNNVFQIQRDIITENISDFRIGSLNEEALNHYRNSISHYFLRYAYNEWYPLNREEFTEYQNNYSGTEPYPYQE